MRSIRLAHPPSLHPGTRRPRTALLCCLAILALVARDAPAQPAASGLVAGRVISTPDGHPLAHALVSLQETDSTRALASTTSADDGSFRLPPVLPGKYNLYGSATGHLASCYLQHAEVCTGVVVGQAGIDTAALTLALNTASAIAGHVVESSGEAVGRASVTLYREDLAGSTGRVGRVREEQTDDLGAYEFANLEPGSYFLSATGAPWYAVHPQTLPAGVDLPFSSSVDPALDAVYPVVFYPGALSSYDASPIPLAPGESRTADFQLTPQHSLSLTLRLPPGAGPREVNFAVARSVFGTEQFIPSTSMTVMDNTVRVDGLPPGPLILREMGRGMGGSRRSIHVDAGSGSAVLDLAAAPTLSTISVHVRSADGKPLPPALQIGLLPTAEPAAGGAEGVATRRVNRAGIARFPSVPSGAYRPAAFGPAGTLVVTSLTADDRPLPDNLLHTIGTSINAELTVTTAPASLHGFVRSAGKPLPGALVVLVPAGRDSSPELFRRDQSDLDGSFAFTGVPPGNYILVALTGAWSLHWRDAAVLRPYLPHGIPFTIHPGDTRAIHLPEPLIPQSR